MKKSFWPAILFSLLVGSAYLFLPRPPVLGMTEESSMGNPQRTSSLALHLDRLYINDFNPGRVFLLSNSRNLSQLLITQEVFDKEGATDYLEVTLTCDHPFSEGPGSVINSLHFQSPRAADLELRFQRRLIPKGQISFVLGKDVQKCELKYHDIQNPKDAARVELVNEELAFPWLVNARNMRDTCAPAADNAKLLPIENYFAQSQFPQLTCPFEYREVETLDTPESGVIGKLEMLLGYKLSEEFIARQDPYAELDFSKAPPLKAVFLSTLVYRCDFYGTLLARALRFHALRGTLVHVVTTGYMMLDKDRVLLHRIAAETANFRVQEFMYFDPGNFLQKLFNLLTSKYRDMHIKLFVTLSPKEENNAVIFGGRNIHDGFVFKTMPDYSHRPELVQYGTEDDYVHWNDLEMKITSKKFAQLSYAHLMRFWDRDAFTQKMIDFSVRGGFAELPPASGAPVVREFLSVPYGDNHALEKIYVSLIDNASKTIKISSPYLRPTDKIMQALERAIKRNVAVIIQTRIELKGDTEAWLYEEVNKASVNALLNKAKIYEWRENSILHSKFILIDEMVAFVGSVNLSRRSFIQDTEDGLLIKDPKFINDMNRIFNGYLQKSRLLTEKQKRKLFASILVEILENQF